MDCEVHNRKGTTDRKVKGYLTASHDPRKGSCSEAPNKTHFLDVSAFVCRAAANKKSAGSSLSIPQKARDKGLGAFDRSNLTTFCCC